MANRLCFLSFCAFMLLGSLFVLQAKDTPARLNYSDIYSDFKYPEAALQNEIDAIAYVEVFIDEYGKATDVGVTESDLFCYRRPIILAIMDAIHEPAMENGKAVKSTITDTLYFPFPKDKKSTQAERRARYEKLHPKLTKSDSTKDSSYSKIIPNENDSIGMEQEPEFDYGKLMQAVVYPKSLLMSKTEGRVIMRVFINSKGIIKKSHPESSTHPAFTIAAEEAILKTKFKPAMSKGKPIGIWLEIPFDFVLKY